MSRMDEDPDPQEQAAYELQEALNHYADVFDTLCQERHEAGAKEYGSVTFLGNDVVRMMIEELADTANYCKMQAIKLLLLQNQLEDELAKHDGLSTKEGDVEMGFQSFKGTGEVGWGKKS